jgi:hypothetical protein
MAAGITALAIFLFVAESLSLSESHAKVRTQLLNAGRWGFVVALSWVLIPAAFSQPGPERGATILGLTVLIGALILIPLRWFMRMGGRRGSWELRRAKLEVSRLANRVKHNRGSVSTARLQEAVERVRHLRTPATAELCDLMTAELEDLMAGTESWNEGGRRSIRIDQLARELWAKDMPPPDNDPDEATFRWFMYRAFGRMMEVGAGDRTPEAGEKFRALMGSLELCRRPDTNAFIAAVLKSGGAWLDGAVSGRPWIASYEFKELGPDGLEEIRWIWGREAAMWGAFLDDDDLRAIRDDLARRKALAEGGSVASPEAGGPATSPAAAVVPEAAAMEAAGHEVAAASARLLEADGANPAASAAPTPGPKTAPGAARNLGPIAARASSRTPRRP